ncbi:MAG: hypothetical protein ACE364_08050 [Chlorobiota bacterium]
MNIINKVIGLSSVEENFITTSVKLWNLDGIQFADELRKKSKIKSLT